MLDRFEEFDIATAGTTIHGRRGGQGPLVLLLHGMPETHLMWHRVAPQLAERFTVVATDLRGGFVAAGHFIPEEAPDLTARYLTEFLTQPSKHQMRPRW